MGKRNIIRISLAALLLILLPAVSKAQTVITGKVSPNEAVIVTAKSHPDGKILGYVMTDNDGKYRLEITSKADSIDLTVSGMDIASQTKTVRNESQACDFVLVEKAIRLKEVTVKAKKITLRHDTINYSVASYAETQDKTVKEVMKKIPGLKVYSTGQIQYNGKWVKDLYIEGMDALGSNYGIAINNINAKDVASIQVMENHQGIKALENKQLGSAPAINLKLKESAKASWNSNVDLAAGGKPFAWDAEANLMRFSKNMQNISFIKSNDIGENLSTELGFDMSGEYRPVDILLPSSPSGLDESAYYINRSASASTNQLHKINADAQISYGINYLYDMEDKDNSAISKYYISGDSTMNVAEDNAATIKRQSVYASVNYKLNSGKHYIQDKINFRYQDYAGNASTQNNDIALSQSYGDKAIDASNSFIMINTTQKKVYTINSLSSFKSEPISLSFGDGSGSETTQNFYRRKFTTQNTLPVFSSYILPYTRFDMPAVLNLSYNSIESRTKDPLETDSNSSQLQYSLLASPSILFYKGSTQITFGMPVGLQEYHYSCEGSYDEPIFCFLPQFNAQFGLGDNFNFAISYNFARSYLGLEDLLKEGYYSSYRTFSKNGNGITIGKDKTHTASAYLTYKDVFRMLFFSLGTDYIRKTSDVLLNSSYVYGTSGIDNTVENFTYHSYLSQDAVRSMFQIDEYLSKGFFAWNAKISEKLSVGTTNGTYCVNEKAYVGQYRYLTGELNANCSPVKWFSIATENRGLICRNYVDGEESGKMQCWISDKIMGTVNIGDKLLLSSKICNYWNNYERSGSTILGTGVEYDLKSVILSLKCINLLDTKTYTTIQTSGLNQFEYEYNLRGRTILLGVRLKLF